MAGNPSVKKRQKELARQEHQRNKAARREQRRGERQTQTQTQTGATGEPIEDPDLAGIVPGPQAVVEEESQS